MSPHSRETLTRGQVRLYVFFGAVGALVVAGVIGGASISQTVDDLRDGCERGNPQREALYNNTLNDAETRKAAASGFEEPERSLVLHYARIGFRDAHELVAAYADVAVESGSVIADCRKAFPKPWPWSMFDSYSQTTSADENGGDP